MRNTKIAAVAVVTVATSWLVLSVALPDLPALPRAGFASVSADRVIEPHSASGVFGSLVNGAGFNQPVEIKSWAGAEHDGVLKADADGNLVVDTDALRWIEFVFAAAGEISDSDIIALARREIDALLSAPAREQAYQLVEQYVRYRELGAANEFVPADVNDSLASFAELHRIRVQAFGAGRARVLFGDEELAQQIAWQRFEISRDSMLTADQKTQRIAGLEAQLPVSERSVVTQQQAWQRAGNALNTLRQNGADDSEMWQQRADKFGVDAADRFADLDMQRANWNVRLARYREALGALGQSDVEARERLRAQFFSGAELTRVAALDFEMQ